MAERPGQTGIPFRGSPSVFLDPSPEFRKRSIGGRIANEILMYMRVKKKLLRETSYYEPIGTDKEGNEIQLLDIMESREPEALEQIRLKDDTRKIYGLLEKVLTEREKKVLIMRYGLYHGKEYTQREIAQKLGISRSYISRIEKNALCRLREYFRD